MDTTLSAAEAVEAYDRGESLWTVEMGGLGPGYEHCIQVGAIELVRKMVGQPLPPDDDSEASKSARCEWAQAELHEVDREQRLRLSGAQAGAIRTLAFRAIRDGWTAMVNSAPLDRRIQFSKAWPGMVGA